MHNSRPAVASWRGLHVQSYPERTSGLLLGIYSGRTTKPYRPIERPFLGTGPRVSGQLKAQSHDLKPHIATPVGQLTEGTTRLPVCCCCMS